MNAPFCPTSRSQPVPGGRAPRLPSIPPATDLPSLIRAVNIMRDILRTLTTSKTVNNLFIGQSTPSRTYGENTYTFSPYPDWYQRNGDTSIGYVFNKSKKGKDENQRVYVDRINKVVYRNNERDNDNNFIWEYYVPLDSEEGDSKGAECFQEDYFERIVNVKWKTRGAFSFAGWIILDEVFPGGGGVMGQVTVHYTWLGGTSKDGKRWESKKNEEGLGWFCCVRGKNVQGRQTTVAAGGILDGPYDFGAGYSKSTGLVPAGGVSYDDGLSWSNAGIPFQPFILKPPDPTTGRGADTAQGQCQACAYHPQTQTFYVGGSIFFMIGPDWYWEDKLYSSKTGSNFSEVYSERRGWTAPFKGFRWPAGGTKPAERLRVADRTGTTKPEATTLFVVSFKVDQRVEYVDTRDVKTYVARANDGKSIILGGKLLKPPIQYITSATAGDKHIVAVGEEVNDDTGVLTAPIIYVSGDDGKTWRRELASLTHENPAARDKDGGSSGGACSFSPAA